MTDACRTARKFASTVFAFFLMVSLVACAPVPRDTPKPLSFAEENDGTTTMMRRANALSAQAPQGESVFAPLQDGNEGLGARLRIIEQAEKSVDLQYFLLNADLAGALIARALLDAADRGVYVRLLVDDIFTGASDSGLGMLNEHDNIDVRLFNPAARPGPKSLSLATDFSRINRRMHNKTFTADGAVAIIGGRNIGDEYYQIDTTSEFADFDMILVGPAVKQISRSFDVFWNDEWAVPMEVVRDNPSPEKARSARSMLEALLEPAKQQYNVAVNDLYLERLRQRLEPLFSGRIEIVSDPPEKLRVPFGKGQRVLAEDLLARFKNADREMILLTPYFVPEDYGARLFAELAQSGVRVRIITNSLLSNNHKAVHAGYERHRKMLLEAGVELHEVRGDALQTLGLVPPDSEKGITMHTKLAIIDDETVFVGSMNLDPRSVKHNTEFGTFIYSRNFARVLQERLTVGLTDYTYRLSLSEDGDLLWNYDNQDAPSVVDSEPGRSFSSDLTIGMTRLLGLEPQL